jgi:hypothetical protein
MLHPELGAWLQRDRAEYADGNNVYGVLHSAPPNGTDPSGEVWYKPWTWGPVVGLGYAFGTVSKLHQDSLCDVQTSDTCAKVKDFCIPYLGQDPTKQDPGIANQCIVMLNDCGVSAGGVTQSGSHHINTIIQGVPGTTANPLMPSPQ